MSAKNLFVHRCTVCLRRSVKIEPERHRRSYQAHCTTRDCDACYQIIYHLDRWGHLERVTSFRHLNKAAISNVGREQVRYESR